MNDFRLLIVSDILAAMPKSAEEKKDIEDIEDQQSNQWSRILVRNCRIYTLTKFHVTLKCQKDICTLHLEIKYNYIERTRYGLQADNTQATFSQKLENNR